ncbi:MFS transporter [Dactylosporangium aurantiacum]|uniref:Multidrug efflux pump Tap n=1 Tax=Dactylosporangium aurantiacum TaxID=35754 RepID=A0A9Q9I9J1_9ACTN|nr:MFS transporter [Dactylosporangium aurantiacum]MDG6101867.1 MFS transporter [Dactylosporangium aurantiacum]UWZ52334.1 MFS transporter [Dactylosporangium aurantiacum]
MPSAGLRHNRDFVLLTFARTTSKLGTQITGVALPLLVLALTGSATDAGLVAFAEGAALVLVLLPAGLLADRHDRRRIILLCDGGALLAVGAVAALAWTRGAPVTMIAALAALVAALGAAVQPAASAASRAVVPDGDLRAATAFNETRNAAVNLAGPPLGGLLFGISPALPFIVDVVSYAASMLAVAAVRAPLGRPRDEPDTSLARQSVAGLRFLWQRPALRYVLVSGAVMNFVFSGVLLAVLVVPVRGGASALSAGTTVACVGLGAVVGSLFAARLTAVVPVGRLILAVTWSSCALIAAMAGTGNGLVLGALAGACSLLIPAANIGMLTVLALLTPDELQGRANAATGFFAMLAAPFGPALAGVLIDRIPSAAVFLSFAAVVLLLALATTFGRAVTAMPDLRTPTRSPVPAGTP